MLVVVAAVAAVAALAAVIAIGDVLYEGGDPTSSWKPAGWLALGMGLTVVLALVLEIGFGAGNLGRTGGLSSAHAMLEDSCAACHDTSETVDADKCSSCHRQLAGAPDQYGFDAHYTHVPGEPSPATEHERERETGCAACHVEHQGRGADIRATFSDRQCAACHEVDSFDRHPEFDFAAKAIADDAGLTFTHIRHVGLVIDELALDGAEDACLACHAPGGRGFLPISFEAACGACHLTGDVESAELPIRTGRTPLLREDGDGLVLTLGVETVETVRARLAPGEQWARRTSAAQFDVEDGRVIKTGVEHADPWILHNLRRLRRALYPTGGLADLLTASADVAPADRRVLYDEALATLRGRTDELRGRDEGWVRATLLEFDRMMETLERRIGETGAAHDDAPFHLGAPDPRLSDAQLDDANAFAARVAEPCLQCHTVERATIRRVQRTQSVLRRARYDHRPHVMLRGCLDCHTRIPVADHVGTDRAVPAGIDDAAIQNVPAIEGCRQCHAPGLSFDRCVTCHEFHPDGAAPRRPR